MAFYFLGIENLGEKFIPKMGIANLGMFSQCVFIEFLASVLSK